MNFKPQKNTIKEVNKALYEMEDLMSYLVDELYFLSTTNVVPQLTKEEYKKVCSNYALFKSLKYKMCNTIKI